MEEQYDEKEEYGVVDGEVVVARYMALSLTKKESSTDTIGVNQMIRGAW